MLLYSWVSRTVTWSHPLRANIHRGAPHVGGHKPSHSATQGRAVERAAPENFFDLAEGIRSPTVLAATSESLTPGVRRRFGPATRCRHAPRRSLSREADQRKRYRPRHAQAWPRPRRRQDWLSYQHPIRDVMVEVKCVPVIRRSPLRPRPPIAAVDEPQDVVRRGAAFGWPGAGELVAATRTIARAERRWTAS
jgi:hypothetical protein